MAVARSRLPRQVTVFGKKITVRRVSRISFEDGEAFGMFDPEKLLILVSKQDGHNQWDTLLHECIHAILFLSGHSESMEGRQEEAIVRALEHGIIDVLKALAR